MNKLLTFGGSLDP